MYSTSYTTFLFQVNFCICAKIKLFYTPPLFHMKFWDDPLGAERCFHRVSTGRRKWYPPAGANEYGWHTPWLAD